ncbi:transposase [Streptomyces sp. NBC_01381]|uniref:transposase n=1 Tax=Streptomyces sp. NBC_01381 TaxID=2903845 RepID=UPI002B1DBBC2|nr:transposase [Streptomyces sp. NBC_01381]
MGAQIAVTSASVQDRAGGCTVLAWLMSAFRTGSRVWADGVYANSVDFTLLSWACDALGIVVEIVKRTDDVGGFKVLSCRWVVERSFGWLVGNRQLAPRLRTTDCDLRGHDQGRDDPSDARPACRAVIVVEL